MHMETQSPRTLIQHFYYRVLKSRRSVFLFKWGRCNIIIKAKISARILHPSVCIQLWNSATVLSCHRSFNFSTPERNCIRKIIRYWNCSVCISYLWRGSWKVFFLVCWLWKDLYSRVRIRKSLWNKLFLYWIA